MNLKELRTDIEEKFEDRRRHFQPLFSVGKLITTALLTWCMSLTFLFSMTLGYLETGSGDFSEALDMGISEYAVRFGILFVALVGLASIMLSFARGWDFVNLILYIVVWFAIVAGYLIAKMIPINGGEMGSLLYTTALAYFFSMALGVGVYSAGRRFIGK